MNSGHHPSAASMGAPSGAARTATSAARTEPAAEFTSCECYLVVPRDEHRTFRVNLCPGRFIVGRSQVEMDDRWFINLESPNCAVSRQHAELLLCQNGDAWVADLNSTNGSFLSIRSTAGEGVRLEPGFKYQLSDGALIIFGEIEVRFFRKDTPSSGHGAMPSPSAAALAGPSGGGLRPPTPSRPQVAGSLPQQGSAPTSGPAHSSGVGSGAARGPMPSVLSSGVLAATSAAGPGAAPGGSNAGPEQQPQDSVLASLSGIANDVAAMNRSPSALENAGATAAPSAAGITMDRSGALAAAAGLVNGAQSAPASGSEPALPVPASVTLAVAQPDSVPEPAADAEPSNEEDQVSSPKRGKKAPPKKAPAKKASAKTSAQADEPPAPKKSGTKREAPEADPEPADALASPTGRRHRKDDARTFSNFGAAIEACITGFDTRSRTKITKAITARGGKVVDEWDPATCNLLVVKDTPTGRTPKLIMAVGNGADVVTPAFVERAGDVAAADCCPALTVDGKVTPASVVRRSILQHRDLGRALAGRSYVTAAIPDKGSREQLNAIVRACGGIVAPKSKASKATVLEDDDVSPFYTGILTGDLYK